MKAGALCTLALCCFTGGAAHAVPITFSFTGAVTTDPFGLSSFNAPISGHYTFDSAAVDAIPGPSTGSYPSIGPAFGFTANVDGTIYSLSGSLAVNTANNIGFDQYGAIAMDAVLTLELDFRDSSQTAFASDALPLLPPSIAAFDFRQFRLFSDEAEFLGSVDSLVCSAGCGAVRPPPSVVPEPGSLPLLLLGLVGLGLGRRHRARA